MGFSLRSQIALYTEVFLSCVSFSIVMPSLWPYLHSMQSKESFLAWVVAFYSIGEAIGAIYFGAREKEHTTTQGMLYATYLGIAGSLLYVIAEIVPSPFLFGRILVLIGRFAQGMWTGGSQALQPGFLAAVLPVEHLTPTIVVLNAFASLGFVVGPAFGLIFSLVPSFGIGAGFHFNALTGPGYFVLFSGLFIVFMFLSVFDEEGDRASAEARERNDESEPLLEKRKGEADDSKFVLTSAMIVCNIIFFVHFYGFALQETMTTPLVQSFYNWTVLEANLLFTVAGICALGAFVGVHIASKIYSDRSLTMFSLALGALGYASLICTDERPLSVYRFLYGFGLISVAFPVGRATTISLYTKLLPQKDQGTGQGIILAVGALARILGPFWAVKAFDVKDGCLVVFGSTAVIFMACMAIMVATYGRLKV